MQFARVVDTLCEEVRTMSKYGSLPPTITGPRTTSSQLVVKNNSSSDTLRLLWRTFKGDARQYATIKPGECSVQTSTYSTHTWIVESEATGKIWAYHNGVHPQAARTCRFLRGSFLPAIELRYLKRHQANGMA